MKFWLPARRSPLLAILCLSIGSAAACNTSPTEPPGPEPSDLSVLFVGNSLTYTNDLPDLLAHLLEQAQDREVYVESVSFPNFGLPDHWYTGDALDRIRAGEWDFVVLQQGPSATEGRPYLLEYTEYFDEEIRAQGASTALFMVWPDRRRLFDFDGVLDSYRTAAENIGGLFLPSGEAWRVAWESAPLLALYGSDGFHPSVLGSYLAAVVMMEKMTGYDPEALPPEIRRSSGAVQLDPEIAALIHAAAAEANRRYP
jgi:hypothetical protein